ncbi:uncharacterized protein Bfra_003850 [Botrytis fragariae]|uniref:Uncharacterized protein n=1 Tax=Botrytis fragariae TaxID=1964551 RepID=A0A8H6AX71_9HELO|nr:uncharacterized protein Bfra_003850 [Botrytis fragariae]KAF5875396.1 hypothetical protein Bfra_003850 [Botrytis fragariae]
MSFSEDEEMMDGIEENDETYFPSVEWPSQQSTWLSHSEPLVLRPAVSGVPDAEEVVDCVHGNDESVSSTGDGVQLPAWFEWPKELVHRPAMSGVPAVEKTSSRFVGDSYTRPLVIRPAISCVLEAEESSSRFLQNSYNRPLVLRPAVSGVPVVEETSPQVVQKNRTKSLVHRPAILKSPRRHDLVEQARIMPLYFTLPHRPRVTDKSRDSRRKHKEAVRKWIERKREREKRGRQNERRKLSESRESDRYENSHRQINPATIEQEIQDIHADLHRAVGNDEHETLQACSPPSDEWHRITPISETKVSTDVLISVLVAEIMKERQHVDEVKNFVNKKHTLEEWQDWGKIVVGRINEKKKNWEKYREMRKKEESRDHGGQKFDKSTRQGWAWEPLSIQSVYYWLDKLDRALEEAENGFPKTHCESKEVEKESAEQRAAKREKSQFVKRHVRAYVDSDSDDPSAMEPAKRKQLPLRQKKHTTVTRVDSGDGDALLDWAEY